MTLYYRPIVQTGRHRADRARALAGGWCWFDRIEVLQRGQAPRIIPADEAPAEVIARISAPRAAIGGLSFDQPRLMGILNVTPDSFSDGGRFDAPDRAREQARQLIAQGADIVDVGGESTRPGADYVPADQEIARVIPVISAIRGQSDIALSVDTRKAGVAQTALSAGATILNDVSAMTHDEDMAQLAASSGAPICLMHAQGDPKAMQKNPSYDDVLLDVYDFLYARIAAAEAAGIPRERIIVDPGIGFGKTVAHNLTLLAGVSLFHALGCAILLGVSRKRFIGTISGAEDADARMPGSVGIAVMAVEQGVQIIRVHDMAETRQAVALCMAILRG